MKTIIAIYFAVVTLALGAGTNYGNIVSLDTANVLPDHLQLRTQDISHPTLKQLQAAGWRQIVAIEQPQAGWVVLARVVTPIDSTTCQLLISSQVTQASIDAQAESNRLARIENEKLMIQRWLDDNEMNYGIGFYVCKSMVSNHIAATMQDARQLILDKAYTKINTNAP